MTGLPTILVELDDGTGTWPHNITAYVRLKGDQVITIGRGRRNESDTVEASRLNLRLDNNDGRFTLGDPTYGVYVDQPIRVTLTKTSAGVPTTVRRITGYVDDWPVEFPSPSGNFSVVKITAYDRLPQLTRTKLRTMLEEEILDGNPVAYYPLSEAAGAAAAGDVSGRQQASLTQGGTGAAVVFGSTTGPTTIAAEGLTAAAFAGGRNLRALIGLDPTPQDVLVEMFFRRYGLPAGEEDIFGFAAANVSETAVRVYLDNAGWMWVDMAGSNTYSATNYADGAVHHVALHLRLSGGSWVVDLYVDGTAVLTGALLAPPSVLTLLHVGGWRYSETLGGKFNGTIAHVAVYQGTSAIAAGIPDRAAAGLTGLTGDRSDQRIARLARYVGLGAGELDTETGVLTSTADAPTGGSDVISAMRAVEQAEGGLLFIDGAGKLVLQNRQHRTLAAAAPPAATLAGVEHDDLVFGGSKEYLVNEAEGSRTGGANQRVVDQASYDKRLSYPANLAGLLVTTDDEVLDRLNWMVHAYAEPRPRLAQVTLDVLTSTDALAVAVLALELGDRITVAGLPSLSPVVVPDLIVEGWTETIAVDTWTVSFNTAPAELHRAWVLGDPTYGVLDATTRLHY